MHDVDAILIAGPTASGKSALAIGAAKRYDGVVINADSMQVYDGLRVLTARPSQAEEESVLHRLYGTIAPDDAYSVGRWLDDVSAVLTWCRDHHKLPVIVGGTGLYFSALLNGLSPIPDIEQDVREKWRTYAQEQSGEALHAILADRDPVMAEELRPSDPQRIVRALEVLESTGRSLKAWQSVPGTPLLSFDRVKAFVAAPEREVLYERCNQRFDAMISAGALGEVEGLVSRGFSEDLPVMRALGVRPLASYLAGECDLESAIDLSKRDTRRYAKRQMTWVRSNMLAWKWLLTQDMERLQRDNFAFCED